MATPIEHTSPPATEPTPIKRSVPTTQRGLAEIAHDLRALANEANSLANQMDEAALEIEVRREHDQVEMSKLRQLQALLKSLNA